MKFFYFIDRKDKIFLDLKYLKIKYELYVFLYDKIRKFKGNSR